MNAPLVKNPSFGSQSCELIFALEKLAASFPDTACHVLMRTLSGSSRRTNHITEKRPDSVDAAHGKNWSLAAGCPDESVDRNLASDQVIPPSVDVWYAVSAAEAGRLMLFW